MHLQYVEQGTSWQDSCLACWTHATTAWGDRHRPKVAAWRCGELGVDDARVGVVASTEEAGANGTGTAASGAERR